MDYRKVFLDIKKREKEESKQAKEKNKIETLKYMKDEIEKNLRNGKTEFVIRFDYDLKLVKKMFKETDKFGTFSEYRMMDLSTKGLRKFKKMLKKYGLEK